MTVHLPDNFQPGQNAGTACGLRFTRFDIPLDDTVVTDWEEYDDVDCQPCLALVSVMEHLRSVPHPPPVHLRIHQLACEAGVSTKSVMPVLKILGYDAESHLHSLDLGGFERQALVAHLSTLEHA